jgi:NAD+ synthase (glutamine-hydrolysing)
VRGVTLMALSNAEGHLVLTTGNKSEIATGYSTLYGDSAGGFGVIKDVPKTLVWALAQWRNSEAERSCLTLPIPPNSITKPPSAELAPGQLDTDSLPSYEVLDAIIDDYVEKDMGSAELIAEGHDPALVERVIRLIDTAEYKRRQYPPGPKISQKNFGRDRRLPITNRWREHPVLHGGQELLKELRRRERVEGLEGYVFHNSQVGVHVFRPVQVKRACELFEVYDVTQVGSGEPQDTE